MNRQSGAATAAIAIAILALGAAAGAYLGWDRHQQLAKARGERLQAELTLTREQLAFVKSRPSQGAQFAPPMPVQVRPTVIRAAPSQGQAVGAASPASPIQRASPGAPAAVPRNQ